MNLEKADTISMTRYNSSTKTVRITHRLADYIQFGTVSTGLGGNADLERRTKAVYPGTTMNRSQVNTSRSWPSSGEVGSCPPSLPFPGSTSNSCILYFGVDDWLSPVPKRPEVFG